MVYSFALSYFTQELLKTLAFFALLGLGYSVYFNLEKWSRKGPGITIPTRIWRSLVVVGFVVGGLLLLFWLADRINGF